MNPQQFAKSAGVTTGLEMLVVSRVQYHLMDQAVEQKVVRVAVRTAKVCTGNWVNAACAAP